MKSDAVYKKTKRQIQKEYNDALKPVAIGSVEIVKDVKKMAIQFGEEMKALAKGCNDINS